MKNNKQIQINRAHHENQVLLRTKYYVAQPGVGGAIAI